MSDTTQIVYLETKAGRVHRGAIIADKVATLEGCNKDQVAGDVTVSTELPESASPETCCGNCMPEVRS